MRPDDRQPVAGVDGAGEVELLLAVEQLAPVEVDAAARVVGPQRGGERRRRRDARMAGGARRGLVDVDGVGVAHGLREAADVAALDLELQWFGLTTDVRGEAGLGGASSLTRASISSAGILVKRLAVVEQVDAS